MTTSIFELRKPRFPGDQTADQAPDVSPDYSAAITGGGPIPASTQYSPAIAGASQPAAPTYTQALQNEDSNPPQISDYRKPLGVGKTIAAAFLGPSFANANNGVRDYREALSDYQQRTGGLQNAANLQRQGSLDQVAAQKAQADEDAKTAAASKYDMVPVDLGDGGPPVSVMRQDVGRLATRKLTNVGNQGVANTKADASRDVANTNSTSKENVADTRASTSRGVAAGNNQTAVTTAGIRANATTGAAGIRANAPVKKSAAVNAQEQTRADMAENVNENLDRLDEIVTRRPDLFGPIQGRLTKLKIATGSKDPDIGQMRQIEDNVGRALTSAHGMRNGRLVEEAVNGILNGYINGPDAIHPAIASAKNSVKTFSRDVTRKGGDAGPTGGGQAGAQQPSPGTVIRYDAQGNRIQ